MTELIEQVFSTIFGNNIILATILISIVPIIEIKGAIPFSMSTSIWGSIALTSTQALLYSLIGSCLIVPVLALIYIPIINALKRSKLFKKIALKIEAKVNRSKNRIENRAEKIDNRNAVDIESKKETESLGNNAKEKISTESNNDKNSVTNLEEKNLDRNSADLKEGKAQEINISIQEKPNKLSMFKRTQPYNKTFFIKLLSVFLFVCVPLPLTGVWTGTCVAVMLGLGFAWSCFAVILGNIIAGILVTLVASIPGFDSIYIVYAVVIFIVVLLLIGLIKKLIIRKKQN